MKKTVTIMPKWRYKDSVTGEDYFSGGSDYDIELDIPDEEFPKRDTFVSNYDYDKAYAKVYDKYKDIIKQKAIEALKSGTTSAPFMFDTYVPLEYSRRQFGKTTYLDNDGEDPWAERPDLYTLLSKEIPDLDIVNEGGINWNWYTIPKADQARKVKELAAKFYPGSAGRISSLNSDDITDSGAHFRLHKYDEDSQLDDALAALAEDALKRNSTPVSSSIVDGLRAGELRND